MKTKAKNLEKGITLIALIITIIVLLILAGVTLKVVIDSKLINNSLSATEMYKIEDYKERITVITASEKIGKVVDNKQEALKDLVVNRLLNEDWVSTVFTSEDVDYIEEDQIKVITKDNYGIIARISEDGNIEWGNIGKEDGEPYPRITVEQITLEGTENEKIKIKIKVIAEVEKIGKTKKVEKIILTNTNEEKEYIDGGVIFEVDGNGTYIFKAVTDQGKSSSKKKIINIQGIENEITMHGEPATARNTIKTETQNGVTTGPVKVIINYGETELQKRYKKVTDEEWTYVDDDIVEVEVKENITIIAGYTDGINALKNKTYNVENVDNVAPTFSSYDATFGRTITATANATDTAADSNGNQAASGIEGVEKIQYKLNDGTYQDSNTFTISTGGTYTIYIKAVDKAGNETVVRDQVSGYFLSVSTSTVGLAIGSYREC